MTLLAGLARGFSTEPRGNAKRSTKAQSGGRACAASPPRSSARTDGPGGDEHLRSGGKARSGQAGGVYSSHKEAGQRIFHEPERHRLTAVA